MPEGARAITDIGYVVPLHDDPGSRLFENTYFDAGITTNLSPTFAWGGGFVEILPVQVLRLRASAQYMGYFGTFGYLFHPEGSAETGYDLHPPLDGSPGVAQGIATSGWIVQGEAEPRVRWKGIVAVAPTRIAHVSMDLPRPYYEPLFDVVLDPDDTLWRTQPTLGYQITVDETGGWLMPGVRYDHTQTFGTDFTRDLVLGVLVWHPGDLLQAAQPQVAFAAGAWTEHPSRTGEPYIAVELSFDYGGD